MHDTRAKGLMVRSLPDGIDPATTSVRLMWNMLSTLTEYERELIVEDGERRNRGSTGHRCCFWPSTEYPVVTAES